MRAEEKYGAYTTKLSDSIGEMANQTEGISPILEGRDYPYLSWDTHDD